MSRDGWQEYRSGGYWVGERLNHRIYVHGGEEAVPGWPCYSINGQMTVSEGGIIYEWPDALIMSFLAESVAVRA